MIISHYLVTAFTAVGIFLTIISYLCSGGGFFPESGRETRRLLPATLFAVLLAASSYTNPLPTAIMLALIFGPLTTTYGIGQQLPTARKQPFLRSFAIILFALLLIPIVSLLIVALPEHRGWSVGAVVGFGLGYYLSSSDFHATYTGVFYSRNLYILTVIPIVVIGVPFFLVLHVDLVLTFIYLTAGILGLVALVEITRVTQGSPDMRIRTILRWIGLIGILLALVGPFLELFNISVR